jgi:hypothetical protein
MVDHKHYTYRVTWSEDDGEHVALCAEFPGLSFLAEMERLFQNPLLQKPIAASSRCAFLLNNIESLPFKLQNKA